MRNLQHCFARVAKQLLSITLFLLFSLSALAQKRITGKVTGPDSQPVYGATVAVKGTNIATSTGADGTYSIVMPTNSKTLVFSYVGYDVSESNIKDGTTVDVALKTQTTSLNEVVVTGYSTQRKKDITGSVSVVNVKDLKAVPAGSAVQMLQGRASGVNIITSGEPGAGSLIQIRGIGTYGNSTPLFIIDGVPGDLTNINASDIESIQVLKDASAASIYGARASNGVLIITTKKGRAGRTSISYDGYVGTQRPLKDGFPMLNTQEMADATWIALRNAGQLTNGNPSTALYGNGSTPLIPNYVLPTGASTVDPTLYNISPDKPLYQIVEANKTGTDWFHELFKPAMIQSHTVSASGGGEKSSYFFSTSYFNQDGTVIETFLKRYTVRMNTLFTIKNNIRIGENAQIFYRDSKGLNSGNQSEGNAISNTYRMQAIVPVYDIMGNYGGARGTGLGNGSNPVAQQERLFENKNNQWDIFGNVFAEVDFLKNFTARTSFGGTIDNGYGYSYSPLTYENAENNAANGFAENSYYNSGWTWTNTLTYQNVFFSQHNVKALIGSEAILEKGRGIGGNRNNYFLDDPNYHTLSTGTPPGTNNSYKYAQSLYSIFGRLDYAFENKYLVSGTLRRDGSSRFGPESRYGWFPSFSLGWRVTEEKFFQVPWINDLKLRGGWGILGNQLNTPPENAFSLFDAGPGTSYYDINGTSNSTVLGFRQSRIGNSKSKWEGDKTTNIGLDATLFSNKLDFTIEWYKKTISGLLFQLVLPATAGNATPPFVNIGNLENKGIDLNINYKSTIAKDWKVDVGVIFTTYNNEVVKITEDAQFFESSGSRIGNLVRNAVGHPVSSFFGYQVVGLFQSDADVTSSPVQADAGPGRFKYRDVDGNGTITAADRTFFGDPNPDFSYGLNLTVNYKAFDFTAFFYGVQGNEVLNYVRWWTDFFPSFQGGKSKDLLYNSWSTKNPGGTTPINENISNFSNNTVPNSYYMEKGSYLRCKSMILGYTIAPKILKRAYIDRLRIYVQAANLFTATKYTGLDPELSGSNSAFGVDYGNYPNNQPNYVVGVSLGF